MPQTLKQILKFHGTLLIKLQLHESLIIQGAEFYKTGKVFIKIFAAGTENEMAVEQKQNLVPGGGTY